MFNKLKFSATSVHLFLLLPENVFSLKTTLSFSPLKNVSSLLPLLQVVVQKTCQEIKYIDQTWYISKSSKV